MFNVIYGYWIPMLPPTNANDVFWSCLMKEISSVSLCDVFFRVQDPKDVRGRIAPFH